ncbi:MAG TPA: glycosyltransferase family 39 protein [Terriglobales bacterium]|nr:glycosyltransferase family 39 protein [Terriglobales bacterium]
MPSRERLPLPLPRTAYGFAGIFCATWLLHGFLLRLPYFWDEAGYFIPAARDLLLTGDLVPHTTLSNAHPPLVMVWLAAWWKLSNYTPAVTRTAMLLLAAFGLLGVWKLAERVVNAKVATAAMILTALYPVVFAQSSLAQLDMPAMALTVWALYFYIGDRPWAAVLTFALAALAKETALITPFAIFGMELVRAGTSRMKKEKSTVRLGAAAVLLTSAAPLLLWYAYHYHLTGYVLGNPEYLQYNLDSTLSPLRILVALGLRFWHAFGYMNLFVLTIAAAVVAREPVIADNGRERKGIDRETKFLFGVIILAHIVAFSVVGGAALARYMLPVIPLVILWSVTTLYRHIRKGAGAWCLVSGLAFVVALTFNPPWRIAPEDNLAYSDFIHLHADAAAFLQKNHPGATVLTAWPGSDELNRPFLGYVKKPMTVVRIENFSPGQMLSAAQQRALFDAVLIFNTKYDPPRNFLTGIGWWNRLQVRFFGYHEDFRPVQAAMIMQGRIVWHEERGGQWAAVIMVEHAENAGINPSGDRAIVPLRIGRLSNGRAW